ncbi:MAG: tetratricopeptide repeat protein [Bacteroidales bacterium]|jgi:tetratricopeptide (TPR) repeat protein
MIDDKYIIRYLDGEMTEDERFEFEKEISGNPDLAKKVEAFRNLQKLAEKAMRQADDPEDNLDQETREEIRQAVIDFKEGRKYDLPGEVNETIKSARQDFEQRREKDKQATDVTEPEPHRSNIRQVRRIWFSVAAVVVLAVIVSVLIFRPFKGKPAKDLYTEYYKEFPMTEEMNELSRTDDDLLFAIKVYEAGDYKRAIILFEMLADSSTLSGYSLFYAGLAYMHLNLTDKAIETFQGLLDDDPGDMIPATRWYLALCYLKAGEASLSKEQLLLIEETDSPFRKDARMLLRDLQ